MWVILIMTMIISVFCTSGTFFLKPTYMYISTSYFELNDNQNISRKTAGVKYLLRTRIRAVLQYHLALTFLTDFFKKSIVK